ncbi:oocyte-secreted protein 3 [Macaca mulatta]
MKDFVGLQSSFLLCVILTLSEQKSVSVGCTSSMFRVVAEPTLLGQDHILHSDEASLGTGCPVTNVTAKGYEFNYPATECGIQKEVEASHPSLLLNMSHPLVHESANVAIF